MEVLLYSTPPKYATKHTLKGRYDRKNTPTVSKTVVTPSHLSDFPCREAALLATIRRRTDVTRSVVQERILNTATLIRKYHVYQVGKLGERLL